MSAVKFIVTSGKMIQTNIMYYYSYFIRRPASDRLLGLACQISHDLFIIAYDCSEDMTKRNSGSARDHQASFKRPGYSPDLKILIAEAPSDERLDGAWKCEIEIKQALWLLHVSACWHISARAHFGGHRNFERLKLKKLRITISWGRGAEQHRGIK